MHLNIIIFDFSLFPLGWPKRGGQILCPGNQNEVLSPHFVSPYLLQGQWRRTNRLDGSTENSISSFRPYRGSHSGLIVVHTSPSNRMLRSVCHCLYAFECTAWQAGKITRCLYVANRWIHADTAQIMVTDDTKI